MSSCLPPIVMYFPWRAGLSRWVGFPWWVGLSWRTGCGAVVVLALGRALMGIIFTASPAAGAEIIHSGMNVTAQELALQQRVTQLAQSLVGADLVEVVATVGYLPSGALTTAGVAERVKLPGVNSYIVWSSGQLRSDQPRILPEFSRVRRVSVIVSDQVSTPLSSLTSELTRLAGLNPAEGDTLQVLTVSQARDGTAAATPPASDPLGDRDAEPPAEELSGSPSSSPSLAEPRSTAFLIQARRRYFEGDYQGALEKILQAVQINPRSAEAYAMLGSLYYVMDWKNLALKYWENALKLDPGNRGLESLVSQLRIEGW